MYEPSKIFTAPEPVERVFTPDLKGLVAWLETQDGAAEYDYMSSKDCLLCRFASSAFGVSGFEAAVRILIADMAELCRAAYGDYSASQSYQSALSRARQALMEAK